MTNQKKLILGAVVVLGAYYLYDRNKKMKVVSDLKAGAETPLPPMTSVPLVAMNGYKTNCEKKWNEQIGKVSRFSSKEGREMSKLKFVSECLGE